MGGTTSQLRPPFHFSGGMPMKIAPASRTNLFAILAVGAVAFAGGFAAAAAPGVEPAPQASAASLLGADVKGDNWTVDPTVKSDGFVRIFALTTPYGAFQVNGQRRMAQRLQELRALTALEGMSRSKAFGDAVVNAGLAPIRFGRDLIVDPVETTGNVVSGIGKMFHSVVSSVSGNSPRRESMLASVIGITAAERELAFRLGVDPYSDFTPLRDGLHEVARVMAAGNISVTAAIMVIPGGAGVAVSATATGADFASSISSNTASEIAEAVTKKLQAMGVDKATIDTFVGNTAYSPVDQYAIVLALETLGASNPTAFVARAAAADSADVAKFNRYRAELMALNSGHLGTLNAFFVAGDVAVTMNAKNHVVAAFPFDLVAWTDTVSASLTKLTADVKAQYPNAARFLATTGTVSPMAAAELKALGWTVLKVD